MRQFGAFSFNQPVAVARNSRRRLFVSVVNLCAVVNGIGYTSGVSGNSKGVPIVLARSKLETHFFRS